MKKHLLTIFTFLISLQSYAQWQLLPNMDGGFTRNLEKQGNTLFGYTYGGVFRSIDNGDNWNKFSSGLYTAFDSTDLYITSSASSTAGTIVANGNKLARVLPSQTSWEKIAGPLLSANLSYNVDEILASPLGFTLIMRSYNEQKTVIYFTSDVGNTWQNVQSLYGSSWASYSYGSSNFLVTKDTLVTSVNGINYSKEKLSGIPGNISFMSGVVANQDYIFASFDNLNYYRLNLQSNTWELLLNGESTYQNKEVLVLGLFDGTPILTTGNSQNFKELQMYRSLDNGITWQPIVNSGTSLILDPVSCGPSTWVASNLEGIIKSTDNGITWKHSDKGYLGKDFRLHFLNKNFFRHDLFSNLEKSADGTTWERLTVMAEHIVYHAGSIIVIGNLGTYSSANNGSTWVKLPASPWAEDNNVSNFYSSGNVLFVQVYESFTTGSGYRFYRSLNGGTSWENISSTLPATLYNTELLAARNGNVYIKGYVSSTSGSAYKIYQSVAGLSMINWVDISAGLPQRFSPENIEFSPNQIFVRGTLPNINYSKYEEKVYKYITSSWTEIPVKLPANVTVNNFYYNNDSLYLTTNLKIYSMPITGQPNLTELSGNLDAGLNVNDLVFANNELYASTAEGIYKRGAVTSISKNSHRKEQFAIYPNPCSSNSEIVIDLPNRSALKLQVYNQQGVLVKTQNLLEEESNVSLGEFKPGCYHLVIDDGERFESKTLIVE